MKMIDVLIKLANDEIKDKMILDIYDHTGDIYTYTFDEKFKAFYDECDDELGGDFEISNKFLNYNVELIQPKPKKYLIAVHIKGLTNEATFLNYQPLLNKLSLGGAGQTYFTTTCFTKSELQSIQPVREFLEDMEGKYELIEVEECD